MHLRERYLTVNSLVRPKTQLGNDKLQRTDAAKISKGCCGVAVVDTAEVSVVFVRELDKSLVYICANTSVSREERGHTIYNFSVSLCNIYVSISHRNFFILI